MKRRELFSSLASPFKDKKESAESVIIRPPYYLQEADFTWNLSPEDKTVNTDFHKGCSECVDKSCATVCEEQIIKILDDGTPTLDFSLGGCTYCDQCAIACKSNILTIENKKNINVIFSIDLIKCLSWNQTMCFSCKDPCLDNAINFLGMFRPEIIEDKCTSCGWCVKACPTDAIVLKIIKEKKEEEKDL